MCYCTAASHASCCCSDSTCVSWSKSTRMEASSCLPLSSKVSFSNEIPSRTLPLSADVTLLLVVTLTMWSLRVREKIGPLSLTLKCANKFWTVHIAQLCHPRRTQPKGIPAAVGQGSCGGPRRCVPQVLCVSLCHLMTLWQALLYVQRGKVSVD